MTGDPVRTPGGLDPYGQVGSDAKSFQTSPGSAPLAVPSQPPTQGGPGGMVRTGWDFVVRFFESFARPFRSSVQFRVMFTAIALALISLAALSAFLSVAIRDGLFEQRVDEILLESARATSQAQATFNSSTANSTSQLEQVLNDFLPAVQAGGNSTEAFLWRAKKNVTAVPVLNHSTAPELAYLVTDDLRQAVGDQPKQQHWKSVEFPLNGSVVPGILVGAAVDVPMAGEFEIYYLYSLAAQQETLSFVQRIVGVAGVLLVGVLAGITFAVTRQVVKPVQLAAKVAERIADGHLDERLIVRGQDEVATLARSFNEMTASLQVQIDQLAELSDVQRRFVSDVSHELRTPLTTVRMASEMIYGARDDFEPVIKRSAELLQTQLDRFEDLLADLLEISRFDAGAAVLDAEATDLRDVVSLAVDNVMPLAERKGVWLTANLGSGLTRADFDPRRVDRILRNLLTNAVEHAEGNPVEVQVAVDTTAVAVVVRDHGNGMDRDQSAHVFDRFWRGDPARARTTGGTGLGLAISREDAHLHGGWLEVWARPGAGCSFRLTLPKRAGIVLTGSPLPLEPEQEEYWAQPVPDEHGPSSLTNLGTLGTTHGISPERRHP